MMGRWGLSVVLVAALGVAAYVALEGGTPKPEEPADLQRPERPVASAPPAPVPENVEAPDPEPAMPMPAATVPETKAGPRPSELVVMSEVRWKDAVGLHVVSEIARQTGLVLHVTPEAEKTLQAVRVSLERRAEKASILLGLVLQPYELDYTVREGDLRIFVDDD